MRTMVSRARTRDERGLSGSLQLTLVLPLLLLAVLGTVQVGVWMHGRTVAEQAARLAVDEARGTAADDGQAREVALRVATAGGLTGVDVQIDRSVARVQAVVSADAPTLLDLGLDPIVERASAPVERVTRP